MKHLALLGRSVADSLSPAIFADFAEASGELLSYRTVDTGPEDLDRRVAELRDTPGQLGFNVTIPHKTAVLPLLDTVEPQAMALGAVNTVCLRDGSATGYNTDLAGIAATLDRAYIDVAGGHAVLFGAGGAARAAASVMAGRGVARLTIVARGKDRATAFAAWLAEYAPAVEVELADTAPADASLYVNATPSGEGLLPAEVGADAWAFDIAYRPRPMTAFVSDARALGLKAVDGLPMLVAQAAAAYRIWFGTALPTRTEEDVLRALERRIS